MYTYSTNAGIWSVLTCESAIVKSFSSAREVIDLKHVSMMTDTCDHPSLTLAFSDWFAWGVSLKNLKGISLYLCQAVQ